MFEITSTRSFSDVKITKGYIITYFSENHRKEVAFFLDLAVWKNTMKAYDQQLGRTVPQDMNVKNNNTSKDIGQIIRNLYTNGGLFENNLGSGIQVSFRISVSYILLKVCHRQYLQMNSDV